MNITQYLKNSHLSIVVKPNAKETRIIGWDEGKQALRADIAAPPEDNKANIEIIKLFTRLLKKRIRIVKGKTSKSKVLAVE